MTKQELTELADEIADYRLGTEAEKFIREMIGDANVDKCMILRVEGGVAYLDHIPDGLNYILVDIDDLKG